MPYAAPSLALVFNQNSLLRDIYLFNRAEEMRLTTKEYVELSGLLSCFSWFKDLDETVYYFFTFG